MPTHASFLFARNVANVLALMGPEGSLAPDWDDEIVAGMCVLRDGTAMAPAAVELLERAREEHSRDRPHHAVDRRAAGRTPGSSPS